jgi:predicted CXXCH cytochrome family protein
MRVRLLHVTLRRSGAKARKEEVVEVERLTVGRGTDNALHIPGLTVALHHCVFVKRPDGIYVEPVDARDLRVNGNVTTGQRLAKGDVVRVGQRELRVLEIGGAEDLTLEIEEVARSAVDALRAHTRIGIERGFLTRRTLSWTFVVGILFFFLAIPLLYHLVRFVGGDKTKQAVHPRPPATSPLEYAGRLIEVGWISGPLARNHSHLKNDCAACHAAGFARVRDQECIACHSAMGRHTPMEIPLKEINTVRCASCHVEHKGDAGLLGFGPEMCTPCHANIKAKFTGTTLLNVHGFSRGHPEFRPAVVIDSAAGQRARVPLQLLRQPVAASDGAMREHSGLKFSHTTHLQPGLSGADGEEVTLKCGDCHTPDAGQALMRPIEYRRHCQGCHDLKFEKGVDRQAPHASPQEVQNAVTEFYSRLALGGESSTTRSKERPLPADREGALAWAQEKAASANRRLLGAKGTCATCHTISARDGTISVAPVLLVPAPGAERWFAFAAFVHRPHQMVACESCHDVSQAKDATTVAMPGIERCRDCHGDTGRAGELFSSCITCHKFHHAEAGLMGGVHLQMAAAKSEPISTHTPEAVSPPAAVAQPPQEKPTQARLAAEPATVATEKPKEEVAVLREGAVALPAAALGTGVVESGVEIRSDSDTESKILGQFEGHTKVEVIEKKADWCRVRAPVLPTGSVEGWVPCSSVKPGREKPAAVAKAPAAAPAAPAKGKAAAPAGGGAGAPLAKAPAPAKAAGGGNGPDTISLKAIAGMEMKRATVPFTHQKHWNDYGAKCEDCHHAVKAKGGAVPATKTCTDAGCHQATQCNGQTVAAKNKACPFFEDAFHFNCIECHRAQSGPTKCAECHSG